MAIGGVPLWIGGDEARHSAELLRLQNWMIYRGQEGFITADAGRCVTFDTPGEGVKLLPGPFVVNSKFPGGAYQAYIDNIYSAETVYTTSVPPNVGIRRDLVVINIEDPYPDAGTVYPLPSTQEQRQNGPYCKARIITDVPANTVSLSDLPANRPERNWTALPAARLDRPQNTATVTSDMIKLIKPVLNPWAGIELPQEILNMITDGNAHNVTAPPRFSDISNCVASAGNALEYNQYTPKIFPNEASGSVLVPTWANYAEVFWTIPGVAQSRLGGQPNIIVVATAQTTIGSSLSPATGLIYEDGTIQTRQTISCAHEFVINPVDRGKKLQFSLKLTSQNGTNRGRLYVDNYSSVRVEIKFKETPYA